MTDSIAIVRWSILLIILQLVGAVPFARLFGVKGIYVARTGTLLVWGYLFWIWGSIFSIPHGAWAAWILVGVATLLLWGLTRRWEKPEKLFKEGIRAELIFWSVLVLALLVRSWAPDLNQTEKFTDVALMQAAALTSQFPPQDLWLSGESLNYYYFGHLLYGLVGRLGGVSVEWGANLAVCTVVALAASAIYGILSSLRASAPYRWGALLSLIFFSNAAWVGQLSGKFSWWNSSRAITDTITEFPFFSFLLGDLHAHFLSLPFLILTIVSVVRHKEGLERESFLGKAIVGLFAALSLGVHYPMNPWPLPFLALWTVLVLGRRPWTVAWVGLTAILLFFPYWMTYQGPVSALRWVPDLSRSPFWEFVSHWVIFLLPLLAYLVAVGKRDQWKRWGVSCLLGLAGGWFWGPAAGLVLSLIALWMLTSGTDLKAPESLLLLLSLGVLLFCEVLYLADPWQGGELRRMNTVFKFYYVSWTALAISVPFLLWKGRSLWRDRRVVVVSAILVAVALGSVYPFWGTVSRVGAFRGQTIDGLAYWKSARMGEREAIDFLREESLPGEVIFEATGPAYAHFGRMATFSGRPAILGWANHERVWRPNGHALVSEREGEIALIQRDPTPKNLEQFFRRYQVKWTVVGSLEQETWSPQLIERIRTYPRAFQNPTTEVYRVGN